MSDGAEVGVRVVAHDDGGGQDCDDDTGARGGGITDVADAAEQQRHLLLRVREQGNRLG